MKFKPGFIFFALVFSLCGAYVSAHEDGSQHQEHHSSKAKKRPHADHNPKHGGEFFMSPDKFHHLEGAMATPTEFRIYLYDDHTEPIPALPFKNGAKVQVQKVGPDGRETGVPVDLSVNIDKTGSYLISNVPMELVFPLYFTVWMNFSGEKEPDLFNFTFDKVSVSAPPSHIKSASDLKESGIKKVAMYQCPMKDSSPQDKPGKCPKCGMSMEKMPPSDQ